MFVVALKALQEMVSLNEVVSSIYGKAAQKSF